MKIHLEERELKQAIKEYIRNQGIDLSQREIDIQLMAGRGDRGHYADIELVDHTKEPEPDPFSDGIPEQPEEVEPKPEDSAIIFDD